MAVVVNRSRRALTVLTMLAATIAAKVWMNSHQSFHVRRVRAWERSAVAIESLSAPSVDSLSIYRARLAGPQPVLAYLFLTTCPTCRTIKQEVREALLRVPRSRILTVSTEEDSTIAKYWGESSVLPLLSIRGELPTPFRYSPVLLCLQAGEVKSAYLGQITGLVHAATEHAAEARNCEELVDRFALEQ